MAGNVEVHPNWWDWISTLVHENAHSILFALARHAPLVENAPEERYRSPLRADPRPIDGIFHAAFVSAREFVALDQCLKGLDSGAQPAVNLDVGPAVIRQALFNALESSATAFHDCVAVVRKHARLTPSGQQILDALTSEFDSLSTTRR